MWASYKGKTSYIRSQTEITQNRDAESNKIGGKKVYAPCEHCSKTSHLVKDCGEVWMLVVISAINKVILKKYAKAKGNTYSNKRSNRLRL